MIAGEREPLRDGASVQPGGRPPAPEPLDLVQAFLNTHYDLEVTHGAELLANPAALAGWLQSRKLVDPDAAAGKDDLARALAARDGLRALARRNGHCHEHGPSTALQQLHNAAQGARIEVRFTSDGPRFLSADGVCGAIGVLLSTAAQAMVQGTWQRLKICPGRNCDWAFYDHSRNLGGRWCSMAVCGGREKARAHYQRRRVGG